MAQHVHIHISTRDAGFNEGAHPRDHGKFTSGGGSSAPSSTHSPRMAAALKHAESEHYPVTKLPNGKHSYQGPGGDWHDSPTREEAEAHRAASIKARAQVLHDKPAPGGRPSVSVKSHW